MNFRVKRMSVFVFILLLVSISQAKQPSGDVYKMISQIQVSEDSHRLKLKSLYKDFTPLWFDHQGWGKPALAMKAAFEKAGYEGLNPKTYQKGVEVVNGQPTLKKDMILTAVALQYIRDIKGKSLIPSLVSSDLKMAPKDINEKTILQEGLKSENAEWIHDLPPQHPEYHELKAALKEFMEKKVISPPLPQLSGKTLSRHSKGKDILLLRKFLIQHQVLGTDDIDDPIFTKSLEEAVKAFQERAFLTVDGVVGPKTKNELHKTHQNRIAQIITTMERWRWMPNDLDQRHLRVNIPAFELKVYDDHDVIFESPVIVGRMSRKTPTFSRFMTQITLNPIWRIPRRIAIQDVFPKIQQDPQFLAHKGYEVYKRTPEGRMKVSPSDVDWSQLSGVEFFRRFQLKQPPGPNNALGHIRFQLQDARSIFLHSTPHQYQYAQSVRTFSAGCVRVKRYLELAEHILHTNTWPLSRLQKSVDDAQTQHIPLPQPFPVYFTYMTVDCLKDHKIQFYPDVYGQDQKLWYVLKQKRFSDWDISYAP